MCVPILKMLSQYGLIEAGGNIMKKSNIINLIQYHTENNEEGFKSEAYVIAEDFKKSGDTELAMYIYSLLSDCNTFIPQAVEGELVYLKNILVDNTNLMLPTPITNDVIGIVNAVGKNVGVNKFLLQGSPGTGKTQTAKHIARILQRDLYVVDFTYLIDSRLGETAKNISELFDEINGLTYPQNAVVLFDEIDSIALDRVDSNDLREMGRATTAVLKGLDRLNEQVVLLATTNLHKHLDEALTRRFDFVIEFDRYTQEDLMDVGESVLDEYLNDTNIQHRDIRLFRKILKALPSIPYPGQLKNYIKTAIAFSNPDDDLDCLRRLYLSLFEVSSFDLVILKQQGFTLREMEVLTQIPKSTISRTLKD